jgi:hypothetical protein
MSKGQNVSSVLDAIRSELIVSYPAGTIPPPLKSPLDSVRHKNGGITLDKAVELNGNRFTACNASILAGGALT